MPKPHASDTIFSVVNDGHTMLCLTEGDLDEWFYSLSAERKALLYELELEGVLDGPLIAQARPCSDVKTLEEHAARFLYDMKRTMTAPIRGLSGKVLSV